MYIHLKSIQWLKDILILCQDSQQPQLNRRSLDVSQIIQLPAKFDLDLDDNDDLLNVSDSVLKDIPL